MSDQNILPYLTEQRGKYRWHQHFLNWIYCFLLLCLLILVTRLETLIYFIFFNLVYEFERILGVDGIKEK